MLSLQHITVGVCGGISAYKSAELIRLLKAKNLSVQVVMTESAKRFISPITLQALSHNPVFDSLWADDVQHRMSHIAVAKETDLLLIASATANFLAKMAQGLADDLLSNIYLANQTPVFVAPAMNQAMWAHPAVRRNIAQLEKDGVHILYPDAGSQACGDDGVGRMQSPQKIVEQVLGYFSPQILAGKKILITAGPTLEHIDPVRAITNLSSGKMGYSLAEVAVQLGAEVTLISGPTHLVPPVKAKFIPVVSAKEMYDSVRYAMPEQEIFISCAAVSDFAPETISEQKIKKSDAVLNLTLKPTTDILTEIKRSFPACFCVGFSAESADMIVRAQQKRKDKNLPLIVANLIQDNLGKSDAEVILIDDSGQYPLVRASKLEVARKILVHISGML